MTPLTQQLVARAAVVVQKLGPRGRELAARLDLVGEAVGVLTEPRTAKMSDSDRNEASLAIYNALGRRNDLTPGGNNIEMPWSSSGGVVFNSKKFGWGPGETSKAKAALEAAGFKVRVDGTMFHVDR